jgi:hypothetical protein
MATAVRVADEAFLDQLIVNQHRAIRYYLFFTLGLVGLGVVVIAGAYVSSGLLQNEVLKSMVGIGGAFVSSLGALQIKEILNRKEKVGIFETLKTRLESIEQARDAADSDQRKQIDDLIWQVVQKTALG